MTQRIIPCAHCVHFDNTRRDGNFCTAFPDKPGIPVEIILGRYTHRLPYPGDHGIQWSPTPGSEHLFDSIDTDNEPLPKGPLGY